MVQEAELDLTDRRSLMASLPKGGIGAEIGVAEGCFSHVLLEVCEPKLLWLIDSWTYISSGPLLTDVSNVPQVTQDGKYEQVRMYLEPKPEVRVIKAYSLDAVKRFEDGYFDWWHLDPDHSQAAKDLEAWWPKLKPGGWGTGHDYTMIGDGSITVKRDVDKFVAKHGLTLFVTRGDTDIYEKNYPTWAIRKP